MLYKLQFLTADCLARKRFLEDTVKTGMSWKLAWARHGHGIIEFRELTRKRTSTDGVRRPQSSARAAIKGCGSEGLSRTTIMPKPWTEGRPDEAARWRAARTIASTFGCAQQANPCRLSRKPERVRRRRGVTLGRLYCGRESRHEAADMPGQRER